MVLVILMNGGLVCDVMISCDFVRVVMSALQWLFSSENSIIGSIQMILATVSIHSAVIFSDIYTDSLIHLENLLVSLSRMSELSQSIT